MKRHGNLWDKIIDIENIKLAYKKAKKGKTWQNTIKTFDTDFDSNIMSIHEALKNKTFTTSEYKTMTITEPKLRTIYKLPFAPDRIIQHALMNVVEPIWDKMFIHNSYACRVGKGIHAGSKKTMEFVRNSKYCLKLDISKFYPSIDHDILFDIIKRKIKCKDTLWLFENIIYSFPGGRNTPIGNYTSQWFGNLYMNELDYFLKHEHHIKKYIRYCDDFCLFSNDKHLLNSMIPVIVNFLKDKLRLTLSKCDLFPVYRGVDFLGYRHFRDYILVRKSTVKRVKRRLRKLYQIISKGSFDAEKARSSIASTEGWLKWANAYNLKKSIGLESLKEAVNA